MAALSELARRAGVVAAATGLSFLGALAGASEARAQAYPPGGGPFVVSATLVIVGGHLTFTATLPFGEPIVVELNLPPLPGQSPSPGTQAGSPRRYAGQTRTLAMLVPDAHGRISGSVTVPRGTVPGPHVLTLATAHGHHVILSSPLRVLPVPSRDAEPPQRPADGYVDAAFVQASPARQFVKPLLAAGAMTVGSGLGGWALRRTRRCRDD
jgi:hypothetical protein